MSQINPVELPAVWVGLDELPIQYCSQIIVQVAGPDEMLITLGQAAPPLTAGTAEEQEIQLRATPFVPVRPMGRFSLTPRRLAEMIDVMQQAIEGHRRSFPELAQ